MGDFEVIDRELFWLWVLVLIVSLMMMLMLMLMVDLKTWTEVHFIVRSINQSIPGVKLVSKSNTCLKLVL